MYDGELDVSFFILSMSCLKQFKTPLKNKNNMSFISNPFHCLLLTSAITVLFLCHFTT